MKATSGYQYPDAAWISTTIITEPQTTEITSPIENNCFGGGFSFIIHQ